MEKLIKLLNEFEIEKRGERYLWGYTGGMLYYIQSPKDYLNLKIISKEYQFIERLIENDKIDFKKVIKNNYWNMSCISNWIYDYDTISNELKTKYSLMILSIQDNPIEFLISILK